MPDPRFHASRDPVPLRTLAGQAGAALSDEGDGGRMVSAAASVDDAGPGTVTLLLSAAHLGALAEGGAEACVVAPALAGRVPEGIARLEAEDPRRAWALVLEALHPEPDPEPGVSERADVAADSVLGAGCRIDPGAVVGSAAEIGERAWIGPGAVIGDGVTIGARTWIGAHASVTHAIVGEDVRVQPGARIGQAGFGAAPSPEGNLRIPQLGRVVIGDRVEIGANSCVDRGSLGDTVIGEGTIIDNLCQVAHNVRVGRHVLVASQTGFSGSVEIGDFAMFGGQAGVGDHVRIGRGARVGARGGLVRDIEDGATVSGTPAVPLRLHLRQVAALRKLAEGTRGGGGAAGKGGR